MASMEHAAGACFVQGEADTNLDSYQSSISNQCRSAQHVMGCYTLSHLMLPLPGWRCVTWQTEQIPFVVCQCKALRVFCPIPSRLTYIGDRVCWYGVLAGFVKHVHGTRKHLVCAVKVDTCCTTCRARRSLENCTPRSGCDRDAWHQG